MGITVSSDGKRYEFQGVEKKVPIKLHEKTKVLKKISYVSVWNVFLSSDQPTFAITPAELKSIFLLSIKENKLEQIR